MSNSAPAPETHAEDLRRSLQDGGAQAVVAHIQTLPEGERLGVFSYAQQMFSHRGDAPIPLDDYIVIARAGIGEALRRSAAADDAEQSARLKDTANIFSFNLLADLAECWPDDTVPRERRHFEEGLRAADDCIRWRDELGKPNDRKSMAWWGRGMHLLSLERHRDALDAFDRTCELTYEGAEFVPTPAGSFGQILNVGYRAIARIALGDDGGEEELARARRAFEAQLSDEARREDAQFGLDQLGVVEGKIRARAGA
ncbi:MAG TPA: hypothetical protein VNA88_12145 [Candidatus Kapabacteria bacterium]|nr:hypothetical protein [Candidatus Kapabacteria bacterium]